jgi:hypothetical protein
MMTVKTIEKNNTIIAIVQSEELLITDVQSALDFVASIAYEMDCNYIILNKEAITEDFFVLSTRLAGDILQKFINYYIKFAVVGEFAHYTSKPLKDFMYESNRGKDVFFVGTEEEAITKLITVK